MGDSEWNHRKLYGVTKKGQIMEFVGLDSGCSAVYGLSLWGGFLCSFEGVNEMFSWPTEDKAIHPVHVGGLKLGSSHRLDSMAHVVLCGEFWHWM
jgi:hypothetical protein